MKKEHFYLPDGFPSMPFWECEWQAKRVEFEYDDINTKYFYFRINYAEKKLDSLLTCLKKLALGIRLWRFQNFQNRIMIFL